MEKGSLRQNFTQQAIKLSGARDKSVTVHLKLSFYLSDIQLDSSVVVSNIWISVAKKKFFFLAAFTLTDNTGHVGLHLCWDDDIILNFHL